MHKETNYKRLQSLIFQMSQFKHFITHCVSKTLKYKLTNILQTTIHFNLNKLVLYKY